MRRFYNDLSDTVKTVIKVGGALSVIIGIIATYNGMHGEYASAEDVTEEIVQEIQVVQKEVAVKFKTMHQQNLWMQKKDVQRRLDEYELQQMMETAQNYLDYYKVKIADTKGELKALDVMMEQTMQFHMPVAAGAPIK